MGVLLLLLLIFVLAFVSVPFLLFRHTVTSGLQDYYLNVYRSTYATGERRTAALPYVLQSNGVRRLASSADVVVLPPAPSASLRLTLSKAAIASRVKGLQFVRVSAWRTDPACAELSRQIQANAVVNRRGIPWWMLVPVAAIPIGIAMGYARHRRAGPGNPGIRRRIDALRRRVRSLRRAGPRRARGAAGCARG